MIKPNLDLGASIKSYSADIEISIQYNYLHFFTEHDTLRFRTSELTDGKIIWYNNQ